MGTRIIMLNRQELILKSVKSLAIKMTSTCAEKVPKKSVRMSGLLDYY